MERIEWRETFQRQPAYYLFVDLSLPMSVDNVNLICQMLQNLTTLSISLKGSLRFSVLGIFALSGKIKCIFPLQSVKNNYTKLQVSLESMQSTHTIFTSVNTFDREELSESLQNAIQQYEIYFQGALTNKEEWPQLQIVFFSAQPSQKISALVHEALLTIELAYVRKIVVLRSQSNYSSHGSSEIKSTEGQESPNLFENDETDSIIRSLLHVTEIEANAYQLENIIKCCLHDCSTDSDHLRLMLDRVTLRCDLRECVLNAETLPAASQFFLFSETNHLQNTVKPSVSFKNQCPPKVPVYIMQVVALIRKEGLCESLVFGHPYIT
ncbi:meiosis 1 arrest protein-like, partial [Stegodyphus dumicola]|uniref:meiosis 1 arrest protein-like n=1 Tax=Stegodyphus dumicola TaxID=202533 RepID=UPI0015B065B4